MKKKSFLYGAVLLTLSALVAKVLGAAYRIPLTNLLGTEGIGLYQLIVSTYAMVLVITSSGMPVVVSRMVSQQNIQKEYSKKNILISATILMLGIGLVASLLVFLLSGALASLQGNTLATLGYLVIAPAILIEGLLAVFRGYFEGLQDMRPTAFSELIEQVVKVVLGLLFANLFLPMGIEYGVLGAILGITISDGVAFLFVFLLYVFKGRTKKSFEENIYNKNNYQNLKNNTERANKYIVKDKNSFFKGNKFSYAKMCRSMFYSSLPITLAGAIMPFTIFIDSILIINILKNIGFSTEVSTSLFGLQSGVVNSLVNLPMIIAISLATAILPSVAASNVSKKKEEIKFKSVFSLKIVWLIALPCFLGFLFLAKDITSLLYQEGLSYGQIPQLQIATLLLQIMAVCILYLSLLRVMVSLLHALNKSVLVAKNLIIASIFKILLTLILVSIPTFNIYGASVATALGYGVACFLNLATLKKHTSFAIDKKSFFTKPLFAGALLVGMVIISKKILSVFFAPSLVTFLVIVAGGGVYLVALIFLKVLTKEELNYLPALKNIKKYFKKS